MGLPVERATIGIDCPNVRRRVDGLSGLARDAGRRYRRSGLTLPAPAIVEAIPDGRQGPEVTLARVMQGFPVQWA